MMLAARGEHERPQCFESSTIIRFASPILMRRSIATVWDTACWRRTDEAVGLPFPTPMRSWRQDSTSVPNPIFWLKMSTRRLPSS